MLVVCDIDGCVADVRGIVSKYLPDWEEYFRHQRECIPIRCVIDLLRGLFRSGNNVVFVTGRPELVREDTEWWLEENALPPHKNLLMRPSNFVGSTQDLKCLWLEECRPHLIIEDDPIMVELAASKGFIVLQVHGYRWSGMRDYFPGESIPTKYLLARRVTT